MQFWRFATTPWAVSVAWFCTVASFGYAIYSNVAHHQFRELSFYADPATAVIVKAGEASALKVTYAGEPVGGDITAAQVVLWNTGTLPIRPDQILRPIVIETIPPTRILESSIRGVTRDVVNARLDASESTHGRLKVNWDILENFDGVRVQIIYAGSPKTQFDAQGVVEGQPRLTKLSISRTDKFIRILIVALASVGVVAVLSGLGSLFFPWGRSKQIPPPVWAKRMFTVELVMLVLLALAIAGRTVYLGIREPHLMPRELMPPGLQGEVDKLEFR